MEEAVQIDTQATTISAQYSDGRQYRRNQCEPGHEYNMALTQNTHYRRMRKISSSARPCSADRINSLLLSILLCIGVMPVEAAPGNQTSSSASDQKRIPLAAATTTAASSNASSAENSDARPAQNLGVTSGSQPKILKGNVSHTLTPFKEDGSVETLKEGTPLSISMSANLNSELAQVGDQITGTVSIDVKQDGKVVLPGQWHVQGKVSKVEKRRRGGLDGYVEIKFDKLVSPNGEYEVPIDATVSTKDSAPKAIAKHLVKDAGYLSVGAVGGAILSVQTTGIPLAVATHGISVGIGAAAGAGAGAVAAARRKGKVLSALPGDELQLRIDKPVVLPAFNAEALPSAAPPEVLDGIDLAIKKTKKSRDPWGDKSSCLLTLNFKFTNKTRKTYSFGDLAVISDHNHTYGPYASPDNIRETTKRVSPGQSQEGTITFYGGSPKHSYWLALTDRVKGTVLTRVPIN